MRRQTKYTNVSRAVKAKVWERDGHQCIYCGSPNATPSCHYIARSQGGLGIEENIVTLCTRCHRLTDQSIYRKAMLRAIKEYLQSKYPNWDEEKLYYRKDMDK